jgi:hypothetical protein
MRLSLLSAATAIAFTICLTPASAASCYELWYERNQIYDENGFCFKSRLGMDTFDNSDCYTDNPKLSKAERRRVNEIKAAEKAKRCKVNN